MPAVNILRRRETRLAGGLILGLAVLAARPAAHDIASDVTVQAFVKPEGRRLRVLVRVPIAALRDIDYPKRPDGSLDVGRAGAALHDASTLWVADDLRAFEGNTPLAYPRVVDVRASLPADRSFASYETALAHVTGQALPDDTQLVWSQGLLDVLFEYAIQSDRSEFSIEPHFARLGIRVVTILRYLPPSGDVRTFEWAGNPGLVRLDPRWHQAARQFAASGFAHGLDGIEPLLFVFCLVLPLRRMRSLVTVVASFVAAHSFTLIASASDLGPGALWFPVLVGTAIAASIVYVAVENIVHAGSGQARSDAILARRPATAFAFGLVHGFGFWFALRPMLQFGGSHRFLSIVSFNAGVELGLLLVLAALVPALHALFRFAVAERIGTIVLSGLGAHTGWHWTIDRWQTLRQFTFEWPELNTLFLLAAVRWLLLIVATAAAVWMASVARRRLSAGRSKTLRDDPGGAGL